jgi:hypothetical protein
MREPGNDYRPVIEALSNSEIPSTRFKLRLNVLGEDPASPELQELSQAIRSAPQASALLAERNPQGIIASDPYEKWRGAHWVLTMLAEIAYPPGDATLIPLREQALAWIFSDEIRIRQTQLINGRYRRHASQQGNLLYYLIKLGLDDPRLEQVAFDLLEYQWPDGGWNCDKNPDARNSSFTHSAIALRGLIYYHQEHAHPQIAEAIQRSTELFLRRKLLWRHSTGELIKADFARLTYPDYHFYTHLLGLKVMLEAGSIHDPRCQPALNFLEESYIPAQGWKIEKKNYHTNPQNRHRCSLVNWSRYKHGRANEFLTVDVLHVLQKSGRLKV